MPLDLHFGDKLVPGQHHAIGVRGTRTKPEIKLRLNSNDLAAHVERLDTEIWKVRFHLPKDAKGDVELTARAGSDTATQKKAIG